MAKYDHGECRCLNTVLIFLSLSFNYLKIQVCFSSQKTNNQSAKVADSDKEDNDEIEKEQKEYFAKGTGYGAGDSEQIWDFGEHLKKIRYDDENIACLLQVNISENSGRHLLF